MALAPTTADLASVWVFRPVVITLLIAAAGLYLWGVARVWRRHPARPWPLGRIGSFLAGLGVLAVALLSAVEQYATTFFWIHMAQHLLLIMVGPALLIHGRPLALAVHATRKPWNVRIRRGLRSWPVSVLTSPLLAVPLYALVVVGTHLTSFNNLVVTNPAIAGAEQAAYLVCGFLYLLSGFGEEPIRWRLSRPVKMLLLVLSMPIDTFTGITLLMTTSNPWPAYAEMNRTWGPDPLTDIHYGGAMMWIAGDTIMIALVLTALVPWVAGRGNVKMRWVENARRATMDRYAGYLPDNGRVRNSDVDEDERRLDAYNAWLAAMAERDRQQS